MDRPALVDPIPPLPIERRAFRDEVFVTTEEAGTSDFPQEGWYEIWEPARQHATAFEDFQEDASAALMEMLESWGDEQEANDTEVWRWADRLVSIGEQQAELDVPEAILGKDSQGDKIFKAEEDAPEEPGDVFRGDKSLPVGNIADLYGNMAQITLRVLDQQGIVDETERLRALDDVVLQARDISQHHIAHLTSGELGEIGTTARLQELDPILVEDETGRYHLDWTGRIKPRPKKNIISRTQHCAAAYRVEGEPSALELLGWAFNTELQNRGFLAPKATDIPPTFPLPGPTPIAEPSYGF